MLSTAATLRTVSIDACMYMHCKHAQKKEETKLTHDKRASDDGGRQFGSVPERFVSDEHIRQYPVDFTYMGTVAALAPIPRPRTSRTANSAPQE